MGHPKDNSGTRSQTVERRSGTDRRREDLGPGPGRPERRRSIEPRRPEVAELDITHSDWVALVESAPKD